VYFSLFLPIDPVKNCAPSTRNSGGMRKFWATLRAIGDKIALTVAIVAREHYYHGR
jgi:hypothetical protein